MQIGKVILVLSSFCVLTQGLSSLKAEEAAGARFTSVGNNGFTCDSDCSKNILKFSTIAIDTPGSSGTASIIGFKNGIYTALTSAHVIKGYSTKEDYYALPYFNRAKYRILSVEYPAKNVYDIALIQFKAPESLKLIPLNIFLTAPEIPGMSRDHEWLIDGGGARSAGISLPSGSVTVPIFRFNEFALQERAKGNKDGYEFIYNAETVPGMSGGPIVGFRLTCFDPKSNTFNAAGYFSLVAIHGRSEEYSAGGRSGLSLAVPIDLISQYLFKNSGRLGIPANDDEINTLTQKQYC